MTTDHILPDSPNGINGASSKKDDNVIPIFQDDGRKRSFQQFTGRVDLLAEPKPLEWVVENTFAPGTVAMLSGDGGVGKSLLLQMLLTAAAGGVDWLNLRTKACKVFGFFCEDDEDELQRRQKRINQHYGVDPERVAENADFFSRVDSDNVLMLHDRRTDQLRQTKFFEQVRGRVLDFGAEILLLDTVADVFAGNEIIRLHVRQFISRLRRLAREMAGGKGLIILTQHPSNTGMNTGTGISGSTAWNNSVRSRLYLTKDKQSGDEGEDDNNRRILKGMKNNYGETGGKVKLRWENGVFLRIDGPAHQGQIERLAVEAALLEIATKITAQGAKPVRKPNAQNSLVNIAQQAEHLGRRHKFESLCQAQDRLLKNGRLVTVWLGPPSKRYEYIRTPDARLPGE